MCTDGQIIDGSFPCFNYQYITCIEKCVYGKPIRDRTANREIFCGKGSNSQKCPSGSKCTIDTAGKFAVCCQDRPRMLLWKFNLWRSYVNKISEDNWWLTFMNTNAANSKCPIGQPLQNSTKHEIFCGLGPSSHACPTGYSCTIDPLDHFAVCCQASMFSSHKTDLFVYAVRFSLHYVIVSFI